MIDQILEHLSRDLLACDVQLRYCYYFYLFVLSISQNSSTVCSLMIPMMIFYLTLFNTML